MECSPSLHDNHFLQVSNCFPGVMFFASLPSLHVSLDRWKVEACGFFFPLSVFYSKAFNKVRLSCHDSCDLLNHLSLSSLCSHLYSAFMLFWVNTAPGQTSMFVQSASGNNFPQTQNELFSEINLLFSYLHIKFSPWSFLLIMEWKSYDREGILTGTFGGLKSVL